MQIIGDLHTYNDVHLYTINRRYLWIKKAILQTYNTYTEYVHHRLMKTEQRIYRTATKIQVLVAMYLCNIFQEEYPSM